MQYNKELSDSRLTITGLVATMSAMFCDEETVTLKDEQEAQRLIVEFEEVDPELMYEEGSMFAEYFPDFMP